MIARFDFFRKDWIKIKTIYKGWRTDLGMWEEKIQVIGIVSFYRYSIWKDGSVVFYTSLKRKGKGKIYKPVLTDHFISREEIDTEYGGNKWLVPINRTFEEI